MRISARHIHTWRAITTWAIRLPAAAAVAYGCYLVLKKIAFGVGTGRPDMILDVWQGIGEEHDTYQGLSMIVIGLAAGVLAPRLSRWIIAMPPTGCPSCGYAAAPGGPCPECGYRDVE